MNQNFFDPYSRKQHSRLNCWVSRNVLRAQYYWNKYVLRKRIIPLHTSVALSYGKIENNNWGDDINMHFLRQISQDYVIPYSFKCHPYEGSLKELRKEPLYSAIGSVLGCIPKENTKIWGSGLIDGDLPPYQAEIYAVRGPKTRERLLEQGIDCPEVYGDPALLLPLYYRPSVKIKKYKLGIVPHYTEYYSPILEKFQEDADVIVINVFDYKKWTDFIEQICSCEVIASSSLHGLIVAEAYTIPNVWIEIGGPIIGKVQRRFKFYDFFASIKRDHISPYKIDNSTTKKQILSVACGYKKGEYNLNTLLQSCPWQLIKPLYPENIVEVPLHKVY